MSPRAGVAAALRAHQRQAVGWISASATVVGAAAVLSQAAATTKPDSERHGPLIAPAAAQPHAWRGGRRHGAPPEHSWRPVRARGPCDRNHDNSRAFLPTVTPLARRHGGPPIGVSQRVLDVASSAPRRVGPVLSKAPTAGEPFGRSVPRSAARGGGLLTAERLPIRIVPVRGGVLIGCPRVTGSVIAWSAISPALPLSAGRSSCRRRALILAHGHASLERRRSPRQRWRA